MRLTSAEQEMVDQAKERGKIVFRVEMHCLDPSHEGQGAVTFYAVAEEDLPDAYIPQGLSRAQEIEIRFAEAVAQGLKRDQARKDDLLEYAQEIAVATLTSQEKRLEQLYIFAHQLAHEKTGKGKGDPEHDAAYRRIHRRLRDKADAILQEWRAKGLAIP